MLLSRMGNLVRHSGFGQHTSPGHDLSTTHIHPIYPASGRPTYAPCNRSTHSFIGLLASLLDCKPRQSSHYSSTRTSYFGIPCILALPTIGALVLLASTLSALCVEVVKVVKTVTNGLVLRCADAFRRPIQVCSTAASCPSRRRRDCDQRGRATLSRRREGMCVPFILPLDGY